MNFKRNAAFTLLEMMFAGAIAAIVGLGLVSFSWASSRLGARNLAFNHGNSALAGTSNRLVRDLQASASIFTLVDFDGTTYVDSTVSISADQDPLTAQYLSSRSNAVRFWQTAAGPLQLKAATTPTTTDLSFDFGPLLNGALPYTPAVNDKLWFPLLDQEFQIVAVVTAPTSASTIGVVRINKASGIGYTLSVTSPNVTVATFFRQVAYSVYNNTLRFHSNFSNSPGACTVASNNITSPKPFSVLYATTTSSASPRTDLRLSFEAYDLNYSNFRFPNGALTLQTVISLRDQPPFVSALQTPL